MKKAFLLGTMVCALFFGAVAQVNKDTDIPPYDVLRSKAFEASQSLQDYETAYRTFLLMDSVYGIPCNDFVTLMPLRAQTHYYNSGSESRPNGSNPDFSAEKALLMLLAECNCFDMADLKRDVKWYGTDTLDYWNEVVATVSPRGYQDTVYQNRLLAMKRANQSVRQLFNKGYDNQDSLRTVIQEIESLNEAEFKQLIAERGFPRWSRVGFLCSDISIVARDNRVFAQVLCYWNSLNFADTCDLRWHNTYSPAVETIGIFENHT